MKAILLATALAISVTNPRAADEPIEFAQDTPTAVFLTEGEPLTLKPRIVRGTGISFQWYRVYPGWGTNAIPGATNLVFHTDPAVDTDYGAYLLRATNSVSEASTLLDAYVLPLPDFEGFLGGWEGNQSDSYQLLYRPYVYPVEQWYKDGVPIPPPSPTGILNEQTQGAYWFTVTNELGNRFFSRPAVLRITPVTEAGAKFRHVTPPPASEGYAGGPPNERMNGDGSVNLFTRKAAYRWNRGALTKALDLTGSPAGFPTDDWSIHRIYLSEDATYADIDVYPRYGSGAIVRRDANGFKTIATHNIPINTEPPTQATWVGGLIHAKGKSAFWAIAGPETNKIFSVKVYDGSQTTEWFNSRAGMPEGFQDYVHYMDDVHTRPAYGFDGETVAFVGRDKYSRRGALFTVTANGGVKVAARTGDYISGTTNRILGFHHLSVTAAHGRVLVQAGTFGGFSDRALLEYDPTRPEPLRLIAIEGQIVDKVAITDLTPQYADLLDDGSVLFVAYAGNYRLENPGNPLYADAPLMVFFRWKDGRITTEFTARQRIGGQQMEYADLRNSAGTNYLFTANGNLWTTAPGAERPADAHLALQKSNDAYQASWTGAGWLQSSSDLLRWQSVLTSPGAVTNDISNPARFFRVFYP